jgi:hypothetical protein
LIDEADMSDSLFLFVGGHGLLTGSGIKKPLYPHIQIAKPPESFSYLKGRRILYHKIIRQNSSTSI